MKLAKGGKGDFGGKKWTSNLQGLFKLESMAVLINTVTNILCAFSCNSKKSA